MAHYAASKSGLVGLTKAMAMEFAGSGVTVNHIPVFFVETPMLHAAPLYLAAIAATAPAKRWGRAEEVAATPISCLMMQAMSVVSRSASMAVAICRED